MIGEEEIERHPANMVAVLGFLFLVRRRVASFGDQARCGLPRHGKGTLQIHGFELPTFNPVYSMQ